MGFDFLTKMPTPGEIRSQYPITAYIRDRKEDRDEQINAAMDWLYSVDWDYRDILHELMTYSEA